MAETAFPEVEHEGRADLIRTLAELLDDDELVNAGFWACLWLSDMVTLEYRVNRFLSTFDPSDPVPGSVCGDMEWGIMLKMCTFEALLKCYCSNGITCTRGHTGSYIAAGVRGSVGE